MKRYIIAGVRTNSSPVKCKLNAYLVTEEELLTKYIDILSTSNTTEIKDMIAQADQAGEVRWLADNDKDVFVLKRIK